MSQHRCTGTLEGQLVEVMAGWDRPLQHYYLTVAAQNGDVLYTSLATPDGGFTSADDLREAVTELGLTLAPEILAAVVADGEVDAGNREVRYPRP